MDMKVAIASHIMFKDNIRKQRKARNLTQSEVAELCGLSLPSYKAYESGRSEPTMTNLIKISNSLELSIDELCETGKYDNEDLGLKMRLKKVMSLSEDERKAIDLVIQGILLKHQADKTSELFK